MEAPPDTTYESMGGDAAPGGLSPAEPLLPALVLCAASIFEFIAASVLCAAGEAGCSGMTAYAVAVGVVSTAGAIAVLAALRAPQAAALAPWLPLIGVGLLVWWLFGWLFLTFMFPPFETVGNGFVACWLCLGASLVLARAQVAQVDELVGRFVAIARSALAERAHVTVLVLTSSIVWVQASVSYARRAQPTVAWAIAVGLVSTVGSVVFIGGHDVLAKYNKKFSAGVCLWWVQGIVISFFPSEFTASVNGYFSLWASVAVAFYYALTIHGPPGVVSPAFQPISQTEGGWPGFSQPLAPAE